MHPSHRLRVRRIHPAAKPLAYLIVALATIMFVCVVRLADVMGAGQSQLDRNINSFDKSASNAPNMLVQIAQTCHVRIGMDMSDGSPTIPMTIDLANPTVSDLINASVAKAPGYKWEQIDGVAVVGPEHGETDLLRVKIGQFRVNHATPIFIHNEIVSLPEVRTWLQQNHVIERTVFDENFLIGRNGTTNQPRATVTLNDTSLRDILNTIVKSRGFTLWYVGRYGDHNQFLMISVT